MTNRRMTLLERTPWTIPLISIGVLVILVALTRIGVLPATLLDLLVSHAGYLYP